MNKQQPNWGVFTNACIEEACDEVATANSDWHKDLCAMYLEPYIANLPDKKRWWVLPGSRLSVVHDSDNGAPQYLFKFVLMIILHLVTMAEPDPTPVSSIRTFPSAPSAPPATSNPTTSATLHSVLPSASTPTGKVTCANKAHAQIVMSQLG